MSSKPRFPRAARAAPAWLAALLIAGFSGAVVFAQSSAEEGTAEVSATPESLAEVNASAPSFGEDTVSAQAARAAEQLRAAVQALEQATGGRAQVSALTETVRAYEEGLAALREALRQAELREATLLLQFNAKRDRLGQLVAVLARMEQARGPLLLLHPSGPLGTARSGMMLAEVTPAIQAEADAVKAELQELSVLRSLQIAAGAHLSHGLSAAQEARTALSKAISERSDLPKRFTEDPESLRALLESAETLDGFAAGLIASSTDSTAPRPFGSAMGNLDLPVIGATLIRGPDEADGAGVRRPGMTLSTRPRALVSAPWPGTIRYLGPLLDYGNVMILEPGDGYLLVLSGLDTVYGEVGEVVAAGAPLGLMGGDDAAAGKAGALATETLYLELRLGASPVDPTMWFAATASTGE